MKTYCESGPIQKDEISFDACGCCCTVVLHTHAVHSREKARTRIIGGFVHNVRAYAEECIG